MEPVLHDGPLITSAKYVIDTLRPRVDFVAQSRHKTLHDPVNIVSGRRAQHVEVVRHKNKGVHTKAVFVVHDTNLVYENSPDIAKVQRKPFSIVATTVKVIRQIRSSENQCSRHLPNLQS